MAKLSPLDRYKNALFSDHALKEMQRRAIEENAVRQVLSSYDAEHYIRPTRVVLHKIVFAEDLGNRYYTGYSSILTASRRLSLPRIAPARSPNIRSEHADYL